MSKFYVLYVEDSEPKVAVGNTKAEAVKFLNDFKKKYGSLDDGDANWVDYVFNGSMLEIVETLDLK